MDLMNVTREDSKSFLDFFSFLFYDASCVLALNF